MNVGTPNDFVFFQPVDVNSTQNSDSTERIFRVEDVVEDPLEIVGVVCVAELVQQVVGVAGLELETVFEVFAAVLVANGLSVCFL